MWAPLANPAFSAPFLIALEEVVVSCLLELLQSLRYKYTYNVAREGVPSF